MRLSDIYPNSQLFGESPEWHDIEQGFGGTCYILAAMGSIAEFPEIAKEVFVTQ